MRGAVSCPDQTLTINSLGKHPGGVTYSGYSGSIVINECFVPRVPVNLNLAGIAPLLCAGITTYSQMQKRVRSTSSLTPSPLIMIVTAALSDVEVIPVQKVNEACERLFKSDVQYRFSVDMTSLKSN